MIIDNNILKSIPVDKNNPSIDKNDDLCSECGHCVGVCREEIGIAEHFIEEGKTEPFNCINCGQCTAVCPENAIFGKKEYHMVREAIKDNDKIVVFSTAPSVRVGLGDYFYNKTGEFVEGKMISALRKLGADFVLDVTFSADLTIMEEGMEFLNRFLTKNAPLPQFTSCCPAWVKFIETFYPEKIPNLSTAKSPIGMQGATIKTYFAKKMNLNPEKIVSVAVTPCTAKKMEIRRDELCDAGKLLKKENMRDNDFVITTIELAQWLEEEGINFDRLEDSEYDSIMGRGSGGGLIFGNTGGVMEAALRMAYTAITGKKTDEKFFELKPVRGLTNFKEASINIGGADIKVAVIYGIKAAEKCILEKMNDYHFIEVMACPGGCISGAGQPKTNITPVPDDVRKNRINSLYKADINGKIRNSIDNKEISNIYKEFYGKPLSEISEKLLHTVYHKR